MGKRRSSYKMPLASKRGPPTRTQTGKFGNYRIWLLTTPLRLTITCNPRISTVCSAGMTPLPVLVTLRSGLQFVNSRASRSGKVMDPRSTLPEMWPLRLPWNSSSARLSMKTRQAGIDG